MQRPSELAGSRERLLPSCCMAQNIQWRVRGGTSPPHMHLHTHFSKKL